METPWKNDQKIREKILIFFLFPFSFFSKMYYVRLMFMFTVVLEEERGGATMYTWYIHVPYMLTYKGIQACLGTLIR